MSDSFFAFDEGRPCTERLKPRRQPATVIRYIILDRNTGSPSFEFVIENRFVLT